MPFPGPLCISTYHKPPRIFRVDLAAKVDREQAMIGIVENIIQLLYLLVRDIVEMLRIPISLYHREAFE
jgi:hypothetical protein